MRLPNYLVALFALAGASAALAAHAPDFDLKSNKGVLVATAPQGHHFNLAAPHWATLGGAKTKPASASAITLRFPLKLKTATDVMVNAYLCDDKNTYCERHRVTAKWDGTKLRAPFSSP